MKKITILGSTGSIGVNALDVIKRNPGRFRVAALAAGRNIKLLQKQIEEFKPKLVAVSDVECACKLKSILKTKQKLIIISGNEGIKEAASYDEADVVISAISGAAGLIPTLAAIDAGKDIALANKETMVMAGKIVVKKARQKNVKILPVDSEHSAIFQCLEGQNYKSLRRIILTASGGPFLNLTKKELAKVNVSQALHHPNWKMGKKITIDSASMMNKGLEVIEARWLFNLDIARISVLIHPQSIVHSLIELVDGSCIAQMGIPDMRIPIAYALNYPERMENNLPALDLSQVAKLEFHEPDMKKFPCLGLAYWAGISGGTMPAVLNAANEIAVEAFIAGIIKFIAIPVIIDKVLTAHNSVKNCSLEDILRADIWAREMTTKKIERMAS